MIDLTRPSGQRCVLKHFWAYPLIHMQEMRGGNLSTAIATLVVDILESCFDVIHDFLCLLDHFCT